MLPVGEKVSRSYTNPRGNSFHWHPHIRTSTCSCYLMAQCQYRAVDMGLAIGVKLCWSDIKLRFCRGCAP